MMTSEISEGVWPVMVTPFNPDNSIDFTGYRHLIEFYIRKGVAGLFACCGSSELDKLSRNEMLDIVSTAVKASAGRVPVVGGAILLSSLSEQVNFIKEMYQTGVSAVILASNQFVSQQDCRSQWTKQLCHIVERTQQIPLGMYEFPLPWHYVIPEDEFRQMASTGRFVFHKDTSCSLESLKQKVMAAKGTKLKIFSAHSPSLLDALALGVQGYCGTGANFMPELYVWLCENYDKNRSLAVQIQAYLTKLEHNVDECENYPANAKAFMHLRKVKINYNCRSALPAVTQDHIEKLRSILDDSQEVCNLINNRKNSNTPSIVEV